MKRIIAVKENGIFPGDHKENTSYLNKLLEETKEQEELTIRFEEGIYHFYPDYAAEEYMCISNQDEDMEKKTAFVIKDRKNLSIEGNNTLFLFHTDILPSFVLFILLSEKIMGGMTGGAVKG